jgi:hypothetical protein
MMKIWELELELCRIQPLEVDLKVVVLKRAGSPMRLLAFLQCGKEYV